MGPLLNRTFFNFTITFFAIVIVAFSIAVMASVIDGLPEKEEIELEAGQSFSK